MKCCTCTCNPCCLGLQLASNLSWPDPSGDLEASVPWKDLSELEPCACEGLNVYWLPKKGGKVEGTRQEIGHQYQSHNLESSVYGFRLIHFFSAPKEEARQAEAGKTGSTLQAPNPSTSPTTEAMGSSSSEFRWQPSLPQLVKQVARGRRGGGGKIGLAKP